MTGAPPERIAATQDGTPAAQAPPLHRRASHWLGFLASGGLAFATDAALLALLTRIVHLDPYTARLLAIAGAMVVGWRAHRRLTFALPHTGTLREFLAYAALQWVAVAMNYGIYTAILLIRPATDPLIAMFAASLAAMVVSYLGMRFGVFAKH